MAWQGQYDLSERTAVFGEAVIDFAKQIPISEITRSMVTQLIRSSTSVGANYDEADEAESRKDFRHKIALCRKEARETRRWIRMIIHALPDFDSRAASLKQEARELHMIFCAITRSLDHRPMSDDQ